MNPNQEPLLPEALKNAYAAFISANYNPRWRQNFLKEVKFAQELDEERFLLRENQERLWSMEEVASAGQGRSVSVTGVIVDSQFLRELYKVCTQSLPTDATARAELLQASCDRLLDILVQRKLTRVRPRAKLTRILIAFFPREFHTSLNERTARSIRRLILGETGDAPIEAMVKCRDRLRLVLGAENSTEEEVDRAVFCWYLAETNDPTLAETDEAKQLSDSGHLARELTIWPASKQRKGITAVKGYLDTWRAVVNSAIGGGTPTSIVESMRSFGLSEMTQKARHYVFNELKTFEFLEFSDGLWHPSDDGLRLTEEDPADVLVERFLVRTYGLAQLLRFLREKGPSVRQAIYSELRGKYPNWKSDFAPSALIMWGVSLELLEIVGKECRLTEYGEGWERRLPTYLPDPGTTSGSTASIARPELAAFFNEAPDQEVVVLTEVSFDKIHADLKSELVINESALRSIHVAWHCNPLKRFVLLSGISGTGKTAVLKSYAESYCNHAQVDLASHLAMVAVAPDWRDSTGLVGYLNTLQDSPTWHREPALTLLLDAASSPHEPFFLILDEINLAHVEQYFAPFLSAMETGLPLFLHDEEAPVNGVPPKVVWPPNLFIGGTMNMDETTHRISDKVLDRAFTIEFWDVDLDRYIATRKLPVPATINATLMELQEVLKGVRRQFGYRTAGEIIDFCCHPAADPYAALDQAIYSKILPRLRGDDSPRFKAALAKVQMICTPEKFPRCAEKLKEMSERLESHGLTHFWS